MLSLSLFLSRAAGVMLPGNVSLRSCPRNEIFTRSACQAEVQSHICNLPGWHLGFDSPLAWNVGFVVFVYVCANLYFFFFKVYWIYCFFVFFVCSLFIFSLSERSFRERRAKNILWSIQDLIYIMIFIRSRFKMDHVIALYCNIS